MKYLLFRISAHRALAIFLALLITTIVIAQFGVSASSGSSPSASVAQADQASHAVTVRAAKRGNPRMNLQDGRGAAATYKNATTKVVSNSLSGARPLSLASGDLNVDGYPDLVAGYASANGSFVTVSLANPEAFAPTKPETIEAIKNGQFHDSFLPDVAVLPVPEAPEFLAVGDFDRDGHLDILTATRGNDTIYLALGDEKGGFSASQSLHLPGVVTAMVTGQTDNALSEVAVGIQSYAGSQVLVYAAKQSVLTDTPVTYSLPATATAIAIGQLDDGSPMDLAVAAGNEVLIIHDAGQSASDQESAAAFDQSQIEHIALSSVVTSVAVGDFIFDRESRTELAALGNDGTVHVLTQGELDTRPKTESEVFELRQKLAEMRERNYFGSVAPTPWRQGQAKSQSQSWSEVKSFGGGASASDAVASQRLLTSVKLATGPGEQLLMLDTANNQIQVVMNDQLAQSAAEAAQGASTEPNLVSIPLEVEGTPVAALSMRLSAMALPGLVVLNSTQSAPVVLPNAPTATFTVTKATDTNDGTCNADCSLREAVVAANAAAGADIITFNAGINPTLTITSGGGHEDAAATGDLDINSSVTITGNSPTVVSTSYTSICGDCKVFGVAQNSTSGLAVSITGLTIQNGFNNGAAFAGTFFETGGGIDFFLVGTGVVYSMSNCTVTNNQAIGSTLSHGGGVNVDSAGSATVGGPSVGSMTLISCTITNNTAQEVGGGIVLAADKHDVTMTNCLVSGNTTTNLDGGGVWIRHSFGGTLNISGASGSVSNNTAKTNGGGFTIAGNQVTNISNITISNNTATGTGGSSLGGGVLIDTLGAAGVTGSTTLTSVTISNNHANNGANAGGGGVRYGGFYVATMTGCTVTGNTSKNGAGVINSGSTQTPAPTLAISGGSFTGNAATGDGGAFASTGTGSPTASVTTFSNVAIGGAGVGQANTAVNGGGIADSQTGSVSVTNNSIAGNSATTNGGGVFISGGSLTLDGVTVDSNVASSGDGLHETGGTFIGQNTLNFNGDDSINIAGGTFNSTAGTLNLSGSFTRASAAAFNHNSGTFNFNGSGAQNINGTATSEAFNNFTVNKSAGTLTVGGSTTALTMAGNVTLTAGTFAAGTATTIGLPSGNWSNNGGTFTPGSSVVSFTNTTGAQAINGSAATQTFNGITMAKTAQTLSVGGSTTTLNLNGTMLLTSGIFSAGTATNINVAGDWTNNGGTFTPGSGTVTFNGGAAQNLNGSAATQTFNNFTVNKGGGTLTVGGSTTTLNVNAMTLTAGTFAAGTAATINASGDWTNNGGVFTPGTGIVIFNNTSGAQALNGTNASQTFNNITVAKTAQTLSGAGNLQTLTLNGTMLLTSGTFAAGTLTNIAVGGNWTNNGGTFTPGSSTVTFNSTTGAQNINGTAASQTFNNLTVSKTGQTLTGGGSTTTLTLNGNFSITAGTFAAGTTTTLNVAGNWANAGTFTPGASNTVVFNGNNNTQTLTGTTSFNNLTCNHTGTGSVTATGSSLTVTGLLRIQAGTFTSSSNFNNVQIDSGTTLASDGSTMNVSGNWTNNGGTFTPNGNTVNFNGGAGQAINGTAVSQTFNNFTVNKTGTLSVAGSTTTLTATGVVTLTAGTFAAGTATTINANGNWVNNGGTFTPGAGTVTLNGGVGQTISGTTATTFNNLTNSNASGLSMTNDNTVSGVLGLSGSDITVAATKTLTQPSTIASTGTFDVVGAVKRTGGPFAPAAVLTFGNPNNQITFGAAGTKPTDLTVSLAKTAPPNPNGYAAAVLRTYTIAKTGGTGFTATLRLRYLDGDLNLNSEPALNLRFERASDSHWVAALPSSVDQLNNFVECNAVSDTMLPVRWTFSSLVPTASNGVVTGRITDQSGNGVEGAVVRLEGTQSRKFITDANGIYRFENVETNGFYTVTPSRANYTFSPSVRSFSQLGETTEAAFGATVATSGLVNPLDTPEYFVRQHYVDFLGREPDEAGFNYWSDQIIGCGLDQDCIERKRENVSAAYFLSIEFQATGGLVDGLYRASYGVRPNFAEFMPDTRAVAQGVVVGSDGWQSQLQANKEAFVAAFVNRPAFHALYDGMESSAFVDTLISHTGVSFTSSERDALVSGLTQGTMTRAEALSSIAENESFMSAKFNDAFVMMEYFGYLRRDADAAGFQFWLDKLNQFGGNFEQAQMVKAFIVSGEYRDRFPK